MFRMTVDPEDAPDKASFLRIEFVAGIPSKIINKTTGQEFTDPLEGFNHLNEVAGKIYNVEEQLCHVNCLAVYDKSDYMI